LTAVEATKWDRLWARLDQVVLDDLDREICRNLARYVRFDGHSVLELGCGRGVLSRLALESGARSATLVDNSAEALRLARTVVAGFANVTLVQADVLSYRSPIRRDVVLSSGLVEHFRGEELIRCLEVHRDHAADLVVVIAPTTPHYNEIQCRTRRFADTFGYERPISARRMARLLRGVGLKPVMLRRFFPLYNLRFYWLLARPGLAPVDRFLDRKLLKLDAWLQSHKWRDRATERLRWLDSVLGGLLLAVARR
jgi:SAM-dependent methyltransferase